MKKISLLKGFTLIELLVVITIIGILATGAVWVYTSQIQKARDSTRYTDVTTLRGAIEQVYSDKYEYPAGDTLHVDIMKFLQQLPKDPKHGKSCNKGTSTAATEYCGYAYVSGTQNGIVNSIYEVSTAFENANNVADKALKDDGNDVARLEMWITTNTLATTYNPTGTLAVKTWVCTTAATPAVPAATDTVVINGNTSDITAPIVYCN